MERSKYFPIDSHGTKPGAMSLEAALLSDLVTKWGMVAGTTAGEDAAGRSKTRLQTPEELVGRAVETVKLLVREMETNGWVEPVTEVEIMQSHERQRERRLVEFKTRKSG